MPFETPLQPHDPLARWELRCPHAIAECSPSRAFLPGFREAVEVVVRGCAGHSNATTISARVSRMLGNRWQGGVSLS